MVFQLSQSGQFVWICGPHLKTRQYFWFGRLRNDFFHLAKNIRVDRTTGLSRTAVWKEKQTDRFWKIWFFIYSLLDQTELLFKSVKFSLRRDKTNKKRCHPPYDWGLNGWRLPISLQNFKSCCNNTVAIALSPFVFGLVYSRDVSQAPALFSSSLNITAVAPGLGLLATWRRWCSPPRFTKKERGIAPGSITPALTLFLRYLENKNKVNSNAKYVNSLM